MTALNRLSDTRIWGLKPADRPKRFADGDGLMIEVQPHGAKLWRFAYRFGGKQKLISMGV